MKTKKQKTSILIIEKQTVKKLNNSVLKSIVGAGALPTDHPLSEVVICCWSLADQGGWCPMSETITETA